MRRWLTRLLVATVTAVATCVGWSIWYSKRDYAALFLQRKGRLETEQPTVERVTEKTTLTKIELTSDSGLRAEARLRIFRFDRFGDAYYALRRGEETAAADLADRLEELDVLVRRGGYLGGDAYGLADIAYLPWIVRAQRRLGVDLDEYPALADWLARLAERPAVAAELELVAALG